MIAKRAFLLLPLIGAGVPAYAQDTPASTDAPPAAEQPAQQGRRTYTPADFARFNPRNALDMLNNVPGFAIQQGDTERRGLGQATGNVLINGERFSSKTTGIFTELQRISASNVVRIEVADGGSFNIAGLSGQVANIITLSRGLSGNFAWRPQIRSYQTPARMLNFDLSLNGSIRGWDYRLGFRNDSFRNGNEGPEVVFRPDGSIVDLRDEILDVNGDQPRFTAGVRRAFENGSILNLNGAFGFFMLDVQELSYRTGPGQPDRTRRLTEREREHNYEVGGDYEFALAGGRLKLIGLRRFEHSPYVQTLLQTFADGRPIFGQRFTQTGDETETIARGEYRWRAGGADWQVSLEGALNQLDVENNLFDRNAAGEFVPTPGAATASVVEEKRAEALFTYGRPLASNLNLQASLGGEYSQLSQTGAGGLTRTFWRPKGFLNLAWRPAQGWDLSARIERQVGQLNFFDFVASSNVSAGTSNAGNVNLVPPQSWNAQVQATRNLGRWGTATARLYGRLISDVVDVIPIGANGQSPGNLEEPASVLGVHWTSTFNFDPLGWRGAKLDANVQLQRTRLTDPLTGVSRPINENMTRLIELNLRHDVPNTEWAWGANYFDFRQSEGFRLDQRFHFIGYPGNLGLFVEHKDVLGLTVRASVDNLLDNNESFIRTFFNGRRNLTNSNILFTEDRDRYYGLIFTLSISGTI
ncbi:MAG: TonB-dependent receptor plug domain-containing protein [Sphingosinicella sp.]